MVHDAAPIHWEAVLITAVPATLALCGTIVTSLVGWRNRKRLAAIDTAVNGVEPGQPTLREKVEAVAAATGVESPGQSLAATADAAHNAARQAAQAAVEARDAARQAVRQTDGS